MARDVHDLAVALGAHRAGHGLDAVEGARDVGVHHLLPGLGGEPPERAVVRHARVVRQKVDATQALPHRGDELLHVVAFAYVAPCAIHRHAERADGGLGEEGLCRDVAVGQVDVVDRDRRAVLGELERGGPAEAGRAPRDHGDPPVHRLRQARRNLAPCNRSPRCSCGAGSPCSEPPPSACSRCPGGRRSTPPGSSPPPSAPTPSGTASTAGSSPPACSAWTTAAPRRPSDATTGGTSCPRTNGCCSDTTSRLLPAPARWWVRCSPRNSASCPARCGS